VEEEVGVGKISPKKFFLGQAEVLGELTSWEARLAEMVWQKWFRWVLERRLGDRV